MKLFNAENKCCKKTVTGNIIRSLTVSMIFTFVAFLIFAVIISFSSLSEASAETIVNIVTFTAVIISGFTAAKNANSKGWIWGAAGGGLYIGTVIVAGLLANNSSSLAIGTLGFFLISVLIGAIGGIAGINLRKTDKYAPKR